VYDVFSDAISVAGGIITGYLISKNMIGSGRGQILTKSARK
jgi:hypothetical protein